MRSLFLINGTDYVWATSEERAKEVYTTDVMDEAVTVELIPAEKPVYIQRPKDGGEEIWWFKLHDGWELLEETTDRSQLIFRTQTRCRFEGYKPHDLLNGEGEASMEATKTRVTYWQEEVEDIERMYDEQVPVSIIVDNQRRLPCGKASPE